MTSEVSGLKHVRRTPGQSRKCQLHRGWNVLPGVARRKEQKGCDDDTPGAPFMQSANARCDVRLL